MRAEVAGYSDHALHALCAASPNKDLLALQLQPEQARLLHLLPASCTLGPAWRRQGRPHVDERRSPARNHTESC